MAADRAGDVAAQVEAVLDHPVAVVEELDDVHAHLGGAGPLLGLAEGPGLVGVEAVDAGLTAAGQQVADGPALGGPAGHGRRRAVLEVVRMGHDRQRALPVLRERSQVHGRKSARGRSGPGEPGR